MIYCCRNDALDCNTWNQIKSLMLPSHLKKLDHHFILSKKDDLICILPILNPVVTHIEFMATELTPDLMLIVYNYLHKRTFQTLSNIINIVNTLHVFIYEMAQHFITTNMHIQPEIQTHLFTSLLISLRYLDAESLIDIMPIITKAIPIYLGECSKIIHFQGILLAEAFLSKHHDKEVLFEKGNIYEWMRSYANPTVPIENIQPPIKQIVNNTETEIVQVNETIHVQEKDELLPQTKNNTRKHIVIDGKRVPYPTHIQQIITYLKADLDAQTIALEQLSHVLSKTFTIELGTINRLSVSVDFIENNMSALLDVLLATEHCKAEHLLAALLSSPVFTAPYAKNY